MTPPLQHPGSAPGVSAPKVLLLSIQQRSNQVSTVPIYIHVRRPHFITKFVYVKKSAKGPANEQAQVVGVIYCITVNELS